METTIQAPRTLTNYEISNIASTIRTAIIRSVDQHNSNLRNSLQLNPESLLKDHSLYQSMVQKTAEHQKVLDANLAEINKASTYIKLLAENNPFLEKVISSSWRVSTGDRGLSNVYEQIVDEIRRTVIDKAYEDLKLGYPYNIESIIEADLVLKNMEGKVVNQDIEKYIEEYSLRFVSKGGDSEALVEFDEDEDEDEGYDEDEW